MASPTVDQRPFRFLDLPTELRCRVYENIEFPTTWHVLDRTQALMNKRDWPVPPLAQIYDSRVTLVRPYTGSAIELLATCQLINKEAGPVLKRKTEQCKIQPVRYLVDYSAAWALVGPSSALRSCLGVADGGISRRENRAVQNFLHTCALSLSRMLPIWGTQDGFRGVRAIEMTITHKSGIVYDREVLETMMWLCELKYYTPTRLVVIYKSPLPRTRMLGDTQAARDSSDLEQLLLQKVPREPYIGNKASSSQGVFVRPLQEAAFERHVKGLEFY